MLLMEYFSIILISIFSVIFVAWRYSKRNEDYWEKRGIPYAKKLSILIILRNIFVKPISDIILDSAKEHGRIFGTVQFGTPVLSIADPDLIKDVMIKDFHVFPYRRDMNLGDGTVDKQVSLLKGEDWKRIRTLITPAFTSSRMRQMCTIMNECSHTVLEACEEHSRKGEPIDCKDLFGGFGMDVIARAAFATKLSSNRDFTRQAKNFFSMFTMTRVLMITIFPFMLKVLRALNVASFQAMDFFRDVLTEVIKERKKTGKRSNDLLQILMDAVNEQRLEIEEEEDKFGSVVSSEQVQVKYKAMTEEELLAQCVMFFSGGYETTASTLTFAAYSLAVNQEWQDKLYKEVEDTIAKHGELTHDILRGMKVLDAVVSETLRLYPAVLVVERTAVQDYYLGPSRIEIQKGARVSVPIFALHRDPEFFPEPDVFNPARFLGMRFALFEVKMCLANLVRGYRLKTHSSTPIPPVCKKGVGFYTVDSLLLSVEKR